MKIPVDVHDSGGSNPNVVRLNLLDQKNSAGVSGSHCDILGLSRGPIMEPRPGDMGILGPPGGLRRLDEPQALFANGTRRGPEQRRDVISAATGRIPRTNMDLNIYCVSGILLNARPLFMF